MLTKILSWLVFAANTNPSIWKKEFYKIKDHILKKYGKLIGYDLQHINKECWTCNGTGKYTPQQICYSCMGSGVYLEMWVILEVYQLRKYQFHRPVERFTHKADYWDYLKKHPEMENVFRQTIGDYIRHDSNFYYLEALYWLFLIYKPALFLKAIGKTYHHQWRFTPMELLGRFLWNFREFRQGKYLNRFRKTTLYKNLQGHLLDLFRDEYVEHNPKMWREIEKQERINSYHKPISDDVPF